MRRAEAGPEGGTGRGWTNGGESKLRLGGSVPDAGFESELPAAFEVLSLLTDLIFTALRRALSGHLIQYSYF